MKAEILKIAGVKSEKEFYKKYPTEEAFMKAHGKEFKKAKLGAAMVPKAQIGIDKGVEKACNSKRDCHGELKSAVDAGPSKSERKADAAFDKETARLAAQEAKETAAQKAKEWAEYTNIGLDPYGEKYGRKDKTFSDSYNKFITANPKFVEEQSTLGLSPEQRYAMIYKMAGRSGSESFAAPQRLRSYMKLAPGSRFTDQQLYEAVQRMGGIDKYADWWKGGYPEIQKYGGETKKLNQLTNFTNDVDDIIPIAQVGTYIPGQGVPQIQNYQPPVTTGIGGNILNMGYGTQPAQIGGQNVFNRPTTIGNTNGMSLNLPSNFLSMGYKGVGSISNSSNMLDNLGGPQGIGNIVGGITGAVKGEKSWKEQKKAAKRALDLARLTNRAARTMDEPIRRQYVRPEDVDIQPEQLFPTYGVGTNYLSRNGSVVRAEDGMQIGGNLTEIQNTYAPGTLYDDLGYQPLNNPNQVKQYYGGGEIPTAQAGFDFGSIFSALGGGEQNWASGANTAVGAIGKIAPKLAGAAGAVAPFLQFAQFATNDIRKRNLESWQKQANQLNQQTGMINAGQGIHNQYSAYVRNGGNIPGMEEGGWVSHDWQPQVITQFGEHKMSDLLRPDPTMDTLRTGGHITQNNMFPTDKYALGGELRTTWGGYAEPISHNPYMPGTGETVMFRGKSHEESDGNGHTGIGVKYGQGEHDSYTDYAEYGTKNADADVEVERGEPATEMIDGETGEKNMVVFGNLKIPNMFLNLLGDPKAKGKKFKNYVADLGKTEERQNKIIEKAVNKLSELDPNTPFDILKMNSLNAMIEGGNAKLKEIADKKTKAAHLQNSINETAEERGVDADALAKGKIKIDKEAMKQQARFGKEIFKAQKGDFISTSSAMEKVPAGQQKGTKYYGKITDAEYEQLKANNPWFDWKNFDPSKKSEVERFQREFNNLSRVVGSNAKLKEDGKLGEQTASAKVDYDALTGDVKTTKITRRPTMQEEVPAEANYPITPLKKPGLLNYAAAILPYIDDNIYSPDPNINPELMAMSMNQLEGVKAQQYMPLLGTPMDISLQDQLNANQADFNAIQRDTGYNPAATAALAAQKYAANSKVLGEQFRLNQAEKQRVYEGNRAALNQAQLQNLGILDTQFVRQEQAKSATKATAFEAMKSIADKFDKKRLQDQTLAVYRNMFPDYRYTRNLRAVPAGPTMYNIPTITGDTQAAGTPTLATNPYVSINRPAVTAAVAQDPTVLADPNNLSSFIDYSQIPTIEDIYREETVFPTEQKYGGKTKKDKRNSNLVKAFRNL